MAVREVHKTFVIPGERRTSIKETIARGRTSTKPRRLHALQGVSFDVDPGEFLGVVGRNGSGKSTLLRVAAGIYEADSGYVRVSGRMSPFIEMGIGFRPDLSARDNVLLNGTILGLSRAEMKERLPDVLAFADLEACAELQVKNFSAGMVVRLAFATAIQVDADVLLVDEVLAMGDDAFQAKCLAEFGRLKHEGRSVVLVTHDMATVESFCDRALLLDSGRIRAEGDAAAIAERYRDALRDREAIAPGGAVLPFGEAPPRPTSRDKLRDSYRPSAFGDDPRRFARLASAFARAEVQVHYQDSVLGYLWAVLRPLGLFAVILLVFSEATGLNDGVKDYPAYLLTALVLWLFFAEATGGGIISLPRAYETLRKMRMPRLAVPAGVLLKSAFNLMMNLVAVAILIAIVGIEPRLSWLELPVLIVLLALLAAGLAMLLSILYVRFRDVGEAWLVAQQLLFFSSPIVFVATSYPEGLGDVLNLSPLSAIFTEMRHALVDPSAPTAAAAAGGAPMLLIPLAVVLGTFAAGLWVFSREAPRIAERL